MADDALRAELIDAACRTVALGLTHGTSGNVSCRIPSGMLITPTGMPYDLLEPSDVVGLDLEGKPLPGARRKPSSEWRIHAELYRARPDIGGIVHGHPPAATAVACLGRDLPAFHYMIAVAGGDSVRCAGYALFGTDSLANLVVTAMEGRLACLLAHHGLVAAGVTLERALTVAQEVEFLAGVYLRVLPLGEPPTLNPAQMGSVLERFRSYGQPG